MNLLKTQPRLPAIKPDAGSWNHAGSPPLGTVSAYSWKGRPIQRSDRFGWPFLNTLQAEANAQGYSDEAAFTAAFPAYVILDAGWPQLGVPLRLPRSVILLAAPDPIDFGNNCVTAFQAAVASVAGDLTTRAISAYRTKVGLPHFYFHPLAGLAFPTLTTTATDILPTGTFSVDFPDFDESQWIGGECLLLSAANAGFRPIPSSDNGRSQFTSWLDDGHGTTTFYTATNNLAKATSLWQSRYDRYHRVGWHILAGNDPAGSAAPSDQVWTDLSSFASGLSAYGVSLEGVANSTGAITTAMTNKIKSFFSIP